MDLFPDTPCNGRLAASVLIGRQVLVLVANPQAIAFIPAIVDGSQPDITSTDLIQLLADALSDGFPTLFLPDCECDGLEQPLVSRRGHFSLVFCFFFFSCVVLKF